MRSQKQSFCGITYFGQKSSVVSDFVDLYQKKSIRMAWERLCGFYMMHKRLICRGGLAVMGTAFPAALPLSIHQSPQPLTFSRIDLLARLAALQAEVKEVYEIAEAERALARQDYLTTTQFARLAGLAPKTIQNRVSRGDFVSARKDDSGVWLIHKSELQNYE